VRAGETPGTGTPVVLQRIMVPLDGSELAERALPLARRLAQASGATLVLVRAERHLWQWPAGDIPMPDLGHIDEEVTGAITTYLERVQSGLPPSLSVELSPRRGYPSTLLEELAVDGSIDLVVMATHGRGGARRLAVGSMADRMVRLGAPTLLVRSALASDELPAATSRAATVSA
jgi:nucleotide-binding universal stress UspA family protein